MVHTLGETIEIVSTYKNQCVRRISNINNVGHPDKLISDGYVLDLIDKFSQP